VTNAATSIMSDQPATDRLQSGTLWRCNKLRCDTAEEADWNRFRVIVDDGTTVTYQREGASEKETRPTEEFIDLFSPIQ